MTSLVNSGDVSSRVSSVLNKDVKQFGKKYMFDNDDESCWNSDQGSPQWVQINFPCSVHVSEIHIQFQGGFVGKKCHMEILKEGIYEKYFDFYPEDINSIQIFKVEPDVPDTQSVKVVFSDSTDFFGRITIYKLDVLGSQLS